MHLLIYKLCQSFSLVQVLRAVQGQKRPGGDVEVDGDKPKKRGRAKGAAKAKAKVCTGATPAEDAKDGDGMGKNEQGSAKGSGEDAKVEKVSHGAGEPGDDVVGPDGEGGEAQDAGEPDGEGGEKPEPAKKVRDPKPKVSPEVLADAWKEKARWENKSD